MTSCRIPPPAVARRRDRQHPLTTWVAFAQDGAGALYHDRIIATQQLQDLPPDEDELTDIDGLPRSFHAEAIVSRNERGDDTFDEQGISIGGFRETTRMGHVLARRDPVPQQSRPLRRPWPTAALGGAVNAAGNATCTSTAVGAWTTASACSIRPHRHCCATSTASSCRPSRFAGASSEWTNDPRRTAAAGRVRARRNLYGHARRRLRCRRRRCRRAGRTVDVGAAMDRRRLVPRHAWPHHPRRTRRAGVRARRQPGHVRGDRLAGTARQPRSSTCSPAMAISASDRCMDRRHAPRAGAIGTTTGVSRLGPGSVLGCVADQQRHRGRLLPYRLPVRALELECRARRHPLIVRRRFRRPVCERLPALPGEQHARLRRQPQRPRCSRTNSYSAQTVPRQAHALGPEPRCNSTRRGSDGQSDSWQVSLDQAFPLHEGSAAVDLDRLRLVAIPRRQSMPPVRPRLRCTAGATSPTACPSMAARAGRMAMAAMARSAAPTSTSA